MRQMIWKVALLGCVFLNYEILKTAKHDCDIVFLSDETIALKYADKGITGPINVLWMYYVIKGNPKAEDLWNNYISSSPRIMFQRVLKHVRETSNVEMVQSLLTKLKTTSITTGALGNAHSCLLDVLCQSGRDEEAVIAFEQTLKEVPIEAINRTAILKVKRSHEILHKPFSYQMPQKNSSSDVVDEDN